MLKLVCSSRSIKTLPWTQWHIFFYFTGERGGVTSSHLGSTGSLFLDTELGQLLQLHQFYRVNTTSEGTEMWPEQKLNKTWPCHIVENLTCGQFGELKDHLFCVCAVAILTPAETKPHWKNNAIICYTSGLLVLIVPDIFLSRCRKSPATNQPSVTKVCLSGESYHKLSSI